MAERKQHRTEQHGLALAQIAVRQIAAEHRRDVDERGVRAVDDRGVLIGKQPVLGEIEDQERPHSIIGKALPHLGEKQDEQPFGVAQDRCLPWLVWNRSEEHTSELQSLMRISYAVFCLNKKTKYS